MKKGLWEESKEPMDAPPLDFVAPDPRPSFQRQHETRTAEPQEENQSFNEDIFHKFKRGAMDLVSCISNYNGMLCSSSSIIMAHKEFAEIKVTVIEALKSIHPEDQTSTTGDNKKPSSPQVNEEEQHHDIQHTVEDPPVHTVEIDTPEQQHTMEDPPVEEVQKDTSEPQHTQEQPAMEKLNPGDFPIPSFNLLPLTHEMFIEPREQLVEPIEQQHTGSQPIPDETWDIASKIAQECVQKNTEKEMVKRSEEVVVAQTEKAKEIMSTNENVEEEAQQEMNVVANPIETGKGKEIMAVVDTETPVLRRAVRQAPALLSPFIDRIANIGKPPSATEKLLTMWLMTNDHPNLYMSVFQSDDHILILDDLLTLRPKQWLTASVINTWALLLNNAESSRSPSTPLRVFFSAYDTMTLINPGERDVEEVTKTTQENFKLRLNKCLGNHTKIDQIGQMFFPILASEHFYLICANLRNPSIDIIDNSKSSTMDKYGVVPNNLRSQVSNILATIGHASAGGMQNAKPKRVNKPWRTSRNHVDCGIFVMLHMETYFGRLLPWNPEFKGEGRGLGGQLNRLRFIYLERILNDPINDVRDTILQLAQETVGRLDRTIT